MKKVNGFTVYEEDDSCALDEYSEQLANELKVKFDNKEVKTTETNITTIEEITNYEISNVKEVYIEGSLLIENTHYTKTDTMISFSFLVPADTEIMFKCGGGDSEN